MNNVVTVTGAVLLVAAANAGLAETYVVTQTDKEFSTSKLEIRRGDSVDFANNDPFFHNVFSLSDAKLFDLGSFPEGEFRTVVFDQTGTVEVECAIHPSMKMIIEVKD